MRTFFIKSPKYGIKVVTVDDEDFNLLLIYRWGIGKDKITFYVKTDVFENGIKRTLRLHRLIMNAKEGDKIDHRDCDGLNNQKSNLRKCTAKQNSYNRSIQKNNTTGFKGVYLRKDKNKFEARIRVDGKLKVVGTFSDIEEAAIAYNNAALKYFGEFAKLNPIQ